jgi:hypothetical protein
MEVASIALVVAALGVTFGWQPSPEDPQAYEVLMQVEPELVDVLHSDLHSSGRQIPIESHVPASVTPIRNIRVVVGTDKLPRTPIADLQAKKSPAARVVRGQEPPLEYTTQFQSDDGWAGDRYSPATPPGSHQFDQRGATIGVEPIRTAQADPWTIDGAQQAATNAGNSLRDSVTSGIQQANQHLSQGGQQVRESAESASREFGQQLQSMTGLGGQSSPPPAATSASGKSPSTWPAPPPLATSTQAPQLSSPASSASTTATWSSIQPQLAPPRLPIPTMTDSTRIASNPTLGSASTGPSFPPPPATATAPPLHSVLSAPATSSQQSANQDWASVWGTSGTARAQASDADAGVGLEPVPPRVRTSAPPRTAATKTDSDTWGWADPPATSAPPKSDERYNQPTASAQQSDLAADAWANFSPSPNSPTNDAVADRPTPPAQPQVVARPTDEPSVSPSATIPMATIGVAPAGYQQLQQARAANGEEVPWKPLLAVSLALAASLGANFFLGVSYADARHRYLSLVAKTTHAFQKEAGIAA